LQFGFDRLMSRGAGPLVALLAVVTLGNILLCVIIVIIGGIRNGNSPGDQNLSFLEAGWSSLMRTLDPGTMGGDTGWGLRGVSLTATLGGLFIVSALIGVITTGLNGRLESLRRGDGAFELSGHTLILGWSSVVSAMVADGTIGHHRGMHSARRGRGRARSRNGGAGHGHRWSGEFECGEVAGHRRGEVAQYGGCHSLRSLL